MVCRAVAYSGSSSYNGAVSRNRHLRDILEGLERIIQKHEQKIAQELERSSPNWQRIDCWRKQIRNFEARRNRLMDRLYRRHKS